MTQTTIKLFQEFDVLTCKNCKERFILYAISKPDAFFTPEMIPQGVFDYCPFCGKATEVKKDD
jgi:hypothetical protein